MDSSRISDLPFPSDPALWGVGERFRWCVRVAAHDPRVTFAALAVAAVLADHYNPRNGAAWPPSRLIAARTRIDRANVRRALKELEAEGFVVAVGKRGRNNSYALTVPENDGQMGPVDHVAEARAKTEGASEPPNRGPHDPLRGGATTPLKGAPQPPEHVTPRSQNVGGKSVQSPRLGARSAGATRAAARRTVVGLDPDFEL